MPPPYNVVTVTGNLRSNAEGVPASGTVTFETTNVIWDVDTNTVWAPPAIGATLDTNGAFTVTLLAMDNSSLSNKWEWRVTIDIQGTVFVPWYLAVNWKKGDGAQQDFADLLDKGNVKPQRGVGSSDGS